MALTQRLELRQGQSLVMTPQLQQAIKLLQMSNLEVQQFVEQELERNPLLERDDGTASREEQTPETPAPSETPLTLSESAPAADAAAALDTDYENVYAEDSACDRAEPSGSEMAPSSFAEMKGGSSRSDSDDALSLEATLTRGVNLHEHLAAQLTVACTDARDRLIGAYLIDAIDEAGYLTVDLTAAAQHLAVPVAVVENVLKAIQTFDPTGAGARTLGECLALQLKERNRLDPAMQALLDNLNLLAKRDVQGLLRLTQVSSEDLADMIAEIKQLNPKPGLKFGCEPIQPVVPDVYVRDTKGGGFHVELNSDTLPRVLVNSRYYSTVTGKDKDAKTYLTDCLNNANWLVRSLDQRARTILKVASEIVRQQDGFFVSGVTHLRPLNLRAIAEAISMHESTVSRVTANKYIATPRGTFELKYFFTSAIQSAEGGEAHSAEAVRHHIRDLIDNEASGAILSDDRIVEILRKTGIDIARRTVAKYREAMRIPSSVERRRLKQGMNLSDGVAAP
ncbi:MAG: RNA polymerase factor sigma-54 [Alphaproteobacteria bacterium]|nr:RNA polymerase factor sigma-54 [Alphaproteobacteria bacterium]